MFTKNGSRGILSLNGKEIPTPNYIVPTTRGAVKHLTHDNYPKIPIAGVFAEQYFDTHGFAAEAAKVQPVNAELRLIAARSINAPILTKPNTDDSMGAETSHGTQLLSIENLARIMATTLDGSIIVAPHDIPNREGKPGKNRARKMEKRSNMWFDVFNKAKQSNSLLLASITRDLMDQEYLAKADGFYTTDVSLHLGPGKLRVCSAPLSLIEIEQNLDNFDLFFPNVEELGDKGIALVDKETSINLHDDGYATDMTLLGNTGYTLAYIHHLLNAREMTANVLLQQHNWQVVAEFFAHVHA